MFGELLGLSLAQAWLDQGCPTPFTLAELGPGRGTLMADILRATKSVQGFHQGAQICLVERSPVLKEQQRKAIKHGQINWVEEASDLPDAPLFIVANEFFDALPVRQFTRDKAGWRETQIGLQDDELVLGLSDPTSLGILSDRLEDTGAGDVVEICPSAPTIISEISRRISSKGGAAIIVDYGDWRSKGDTFQAVQAHAPIDPLLAPGEADLTAHVDFEALSSAAQNVAVSHMTPQGVFLERLGITARAQALAKNLMGDALVSHIAAHRRLTHGEEMGTLFKGIALHPTGTEPPAGFEK